MTKHSLSVSAKAVIDARRWYFGASPHRFDLNRKWHIPGGIRDDATESLEHTLVREVNEETGIDLSSQNPKP